MGQARLFSGGTSLLATVMSPLDTGDWTIAGWAYPTSAGASNAGTIMQAAIAGPAGRQNLRFNSASLDLIVRQIGTTNGQCITSTLLALNKWWCVVATFRSSSGIPHCFIGDEQTPMAEAAYASTQALVTRSTGGNLLTLGNVNGSGNGWAGALGPQIADGREWSLAEMEYFRRCGRPPSFGVLRYWFPLDSLIKTTSERDKAGLVADAAMTNNQGFQTGPSLWMPRLPSPRPTKLIQRYR